MERSHTAIQLVPAGSVCPPLSETRVCNDKACAINCEISQWGEWTECSVPCGGSTNKAKAKEHITPRCPEGLAIEELFNTQKCDVDCIFGYTTWSQLQSGVWWR